MLAADAVATRHGGRIILSIHDELVFTVPTQRLDGFVREAAALASPSAARGPN
jgi:hypothetical protein